MTDAQGQTGQQVSCGMCGVSVPSPPIAWMSEIDPRRGQLWFCDSCSREHLRAIEAKLSQEWW